MVYECNSNSMVIKREPHDMDSSANLFGVGLDENGAQADDSADLSLPHIVPGVTIDNSFDVSQKLLSPDPRHPDLWCAVSVSRARGHRLCLHFDGYSTMFDFWTNCFDPLLRSAGFCRETDRLLTPPRGFDPEQFEWDGYLGMVSCTLPDDRAFYHRHFRRGVNARRLQKHTPVFIEDPYDPDSQCVAGTVMDIVDNRWILVGSADAKLPVICWMDADTSPFYWLENENRPSTEVAANVFGFQRGMILEVVDPTNATCIRSACVKEISRNRLLLSMLYNGEGVEDFWLPCTSSEIFPLGFCEQTGFPLDVTMDAETVEFDDLPDRLQHRSKKANNAEAQSSTSPTITTVAPTVIKAEAMDCDTNTDCDKQDADDGPPVLKRVDSFDEQSTSSTTGSATEEVTAADVFYPPSFPPSVANPTISPCVQMLFEDVQIPLIRELKCMSSGQLCSQLGSLPGSSIDTRVFSEQDIDGEALLLLSEADMAQLLGLKLGAIAKISAWLHLAKAKS